MRTKEFTPAFTKQRRGVLDVISESSDHLTANEVFDLAKKKLPGISFATVYNSLRYLKNAGLIGEVRFGNGASRFDRMTERHDHAVCHSCEKLLDLELELPKPLVERAIRLSGFSSCSIELTLKGLCSACAEP